MAKNKRVSGVDRSDASNAGGMPRRKSRGRRQDAPVATESSAGPTGADLANLTEEEGSTLASGTQVPATSRASSIVRGAADAGTRAMDSVRSHPVPALMIGAGVAWLLVESVNRRTRVLDRAAESLGRAAGRMSETVGEVAKSGTERVRQSAGQLGEYFRTGASAAGGALRGGASAIGHGAQAGYEYGRETLAETWERHPLSVGLAAVAAGVAAGLLLPGTRPEEKLMGETSGKVARLARTAGEDLLERGKKVVTAAADATTRETHRAGLTPGQLGKKAGRIASSARVALESGVNG